MAPYKPGLGVEEETALVAASHAKIGGVSAEQPKIRGTSHDLSHAGGAACHFCHLPVGGAGPLAKPKWDSRHTGGRFVAYGGVQRETPVRSRPKGPSLVCLSCHDGNIGPDQTLETAFGLVAWEGTMGIFGPVLVNDHPIAGSYPTEWGRGFQLAKNGRVGTLPLFGKDRSEIGCASCHDPHHETFAPFLRLSMAQGSLCTTCHVK